MSTKNIIILGPPGSGKGTQAKLMAEKYGLIYLGTGDMLREEAKKDTEMGKEIQAVWDRGQGELVPEDLTNKLVNDKIAVAGNSGIVFDGYPRSIYQAKNLEKSIPASKDLIVLNIEVPAEDLVERMSTRRVCEKCGKIFFRPGDKGITECDECGGKLVQRQEDEPAVIQKRIEVYEKATVPLIDYYKSKTTFINIDGRPPIEEVTREITSRLDPIL